MRVMPEIPNEMIAQGEETKRINHGEKLPVAVEYAWDFEGDTFVTEGGRYKRVKKDEAVKVWIYKMLKTPRYRYAAYSWDYGHEFEELIKKGVVGDQLQVLVRRYLNECLLQNPYIKRIKNIQTQLKNDDLSIDFVVETLYSEVRISV